MSLSFKFQPEKAVQAMGYILGRLGATDKAKLMKLLYLADREHFIRTGLPITGDRQCAMKWGPVPSGCLDLINGLSLIPKERVFRYLHVNDNQVELRESPGQNLLTDSDRQVLNHVIEQWGGEGTWKVSKWTHSLPEYLECYVERTSKTIPYDKIAKFSGSDSRFRLGRPVISQEMASSINRPFPVADADL